jgi:flagellar hook-basal body complex protein FliE
MPIAGIGGVAGTNLSQLAELYRQQVGGVGGAGGAGGTGTDAAGALATGPNLAAQNRSTDFANAIGEGLQRLEGLDRTAQQKSVQAATGDLTDVHDYVIAATEAQTATELTTTLRNKALEAFQEIMRMPL